MDEREREREVGDDDEGMEERKGERQREDVLVERGGVRWVWVTRRPGLARDRPEFKPGIPTKSGQMSKTLNGPTRTKLSRFSEQF